MADGWADEAQRAAVRFGVLEECAFAIGCAFGGQELELSIWRAIPLAWHIVLRCAAARRGCAERACVRADACAAAAAALQPPPLLARPGSQPSHLNRC